jgi:hypothetical protein
MTTASMPYGFRVVGSKTGRRRLVDAAAAFAACCACDPRAESDRESYLSAFTYGEDFRRHLEETSSTKGYGGPCWGPWLWWDIDRENDPEHALRDARRLIAFLLDRYPVLDDDDLLAFFSGSKGYHVGLPTFWNPAPSVLFNRAARRFAENIAASAGVGIDAGVYDAVRLFRAPNSRHPKTGLYKRRLTHDELMGMSLDGIRRLAERPEPFDLPAPAATCEQADADWQAAMTTVCQQSEEKTRRAAVSDGSPRLNRTTLDFIRDAAAQGDRHRLLFSAAANLAEFACPPALAHALLTEAALDSGLTPADVRRQIECGLSHTGKGANDHG